jgi:hypothetical protein
MEVFMPLDTVEPLLRGLGLQAVSVDTSNSDMDVWDLGEDDIDRVAKVCVGEDGGGSGGDGGGCSHARRAAQRRASERVMTFLDTEREAGIHRASPEFDFVGEQDMNALCARVVIYAEKKQ